MMGRVIGPVIARVMTASKTKKIRYEETQNKSLVKQRYFKIIIETLQKR